MKDNFKYYTYFVIVPSVISFAGAVLHIMIENQHYKSEWLSSESVIAMLTASTLIYTGLLSVLCLPVLFLKTNVVRNNKLLQLLSWFLLPVGFIFIVIVHENISFLIMELGASEQLISFLILNTPLLIGLIIGYLFYRKRSKSFSL